MRVVGVGLLFCACSLWGISCRQKLIAQRDLLYEIRRMLLFLQTLLQTGSPETGELFSALKNGAFTKLNFLQKLKFSPSLPPKVVWNEAVQAERYDKETENVLLEVGHILGRYDSLTQQRQLEQILLRLSPLIQSREEKAEKEGKLYSSGGVLLGFLAVILWLK